MKIFKQTHQKRPEARVDLGGHQTNKVKMISIQFWGTPTTHTRMLEAYEGESDVSGRGQRPETIKPMK